MLKRFLSLLLLVSFVITMSSCDNFSKKDNNINSKEESEYSFTEGKYYATGDKEIEITWLMRDDEQESLNVKGKFFDDVAALTGVRIKPQPVIPKNLSNQINLSLASGNLPDIIQGNDSDADAFLRYGEEGAFLPVGNIIEKYAPNLKAKLLDDPRYKEARMWSTAVNGKQYIIPSLRNNQGFGQHLTIRTDLLKKYNISMPKTIDELDKFLKVIQEGESKEMAKEDRKFYAFGAVDLLTNPYILFAFDTAKDFVLENGKIIYGPTTDNYKQALQWLNSLYKAGMMPQEIFSLSENQYYELYYNGSIGVGMNSLARIKKANEVFNKLYKPKGKDYKMELLVPIKSKAGVVYPNTEAFQKQTNVISAKTKYPVECVRLLDWFFTEEGYLLATKSLGLKEGSGADGVAKEFYSNYKEVKAKYPQWYDETLKKIKDEIASGVPNANKYLNKDGEIGGYFYFPSPDEIKIRSKYGDFMRQCPSGIDLQMGDLSQPATATDETQKAVRYLTANFPDPLDPLKTSLGSYPFRFTRFTPDEAKRVADLQANITTLTDQYYAKFISGQVSFDQWDKYLSELKALGLDELIQLFNSGYQRYITSAK